MYSDLKSYEYENCYFLKSSIELFLFKNAIQNILTHASIENKIKRFDLFSIDHMPLSPNSIGLNKTNYDKFKHDWNC